MAPQIQIPERVTQCRCYFNNARLNCTGELTMPNLTRPTVDVSGAGIAGTISTPTRGNLDSMQASFSARVVTKEMIQAFAPGAHSLEFRAVMQNIGVDGSQIESTFSCFMKVFSRGITSGTVANAAEMGASAEFEVLDMLLQIDGVTLVNISKANGIVQFINENGDLVDENETAQNWLGA